MHIFCGTPSYMSPEIVLRKGYKGPPTDIWALGVVLYAILCGTFPFKGSNIKELYTHITQGLISFPSYISHSSRSLISQMLSLDPDKRPNIGKILNNPWIIPSITNIQLCPVPNTTKNRSVSIEAREAYMGSMHDGSKKKELILESFKSKNDNQENIIRLAQTEYHSTPNNKKKLTEEDIDFELINSIVKLGYTIEEIKKEIKNKDSYIRIIYDKYEKRKQILKFTPEILSMKSRDRKSVV